MDTLKPSALTTELLNTGQSGVPLVICSEAPRVRKRIESAGYQEVKINKELSKRLLDIPKEDRPKLVEKALKGIQIFDFGFDIHRDCGNSFLHVFFQVDFNELGLCHGFISESLLLQDLDALLKALPDSCCAAGH